ncbi:MAG: PAS domain S-box protein [Deltaproteobacteria bacterium]|nr:PAS domain S-box protein [Deltaproteobacteria bacterium]
MTENKDYKTLNKRNMEQEKELHELKQANKALRESEEKYRMLFDHAGFSIVLIDADTGKRLEFNRMAHESRGYTFEEYQDIVPSDIEEKESPNETVRHIKRIINKGEDTFETKHRTKDGEIRDILTSAVAVRINGKHLIQNISHDITERKRAEEALKEREFELEIKTESLEEMNAALKVLLRQREEDRIELEEKVSLNVRELVLPNLDKLKKTKLDERQTAYVEILESNLNDITSPLIRRLSFKYLNLTPKEIQVANLVKQGRTTKEIAELLNLAKKTIDFHRENIRKKLEINNKKANLRSHLLSME